MGSGNLAIGRVPFEFAQTAVAPYKFGHLRYQGIPEGSKRFFQKIGATRYEQLFNYQGPRSSGWRLPYEYMVFNEAGWLKQDLFARLRLAFKDDADFREHGQEELDEAVKDYAEFERQNYLHTHHDEKKDDKERNANDTEERARRYMYSMSSELFDAKKGIKRDSTGQIIGAIDVKGNKVDLRKTHEELYRERYRIDFLKDIRKFIPEELMWLYKGTKEKPTKADSIMSNPNYGKFVEAITRTRLLSFKNNDNNYEHFYEFFRASINEVTKDPEKAKNYANLSKDEKEEYDKGLARDRDAIKKIYRDISGYDENGVYLPAVKDKNGVYHKEGFLTDAQLDNLTDKEAYINGQKNPLYIRVWSFGDSPIEKLDPKKMEHWFGQQSFGREWRNVSAVFQAKQKVDAFIMHPDDKTLAELKGILLYKSEHDDQKLRDDLAEVLITYLAENPWLRTLLPPGVDDFIKLFPGAALSEAQQAGGKLAEALDSEELRQKILDLHARHVITDAKAEQLMTTLRLSLLFRSIPILQLILIGTLFAALKQVAPVEARMK